MIYTLRISGLNAHDEAILWSIDLPLTESSVTLECEICPKILPDFSIRIDWEFKPLGLDLTA